ASLSPSSLRSLSGPRYPPHLVSFPTRRSSDLLKRLSKCVIKLYNCIFKLIIISNINTFPIYITMHSHISITSHFIFSKPTKSFRSEEHTSELQSRFDLVCRLLLEKKN